MPGRLYFWWDFILGFYASISDTFFRDTVSEEKPLGLEQDIEQYITQQRQTHSRDFLLNVRSRLTLLGELHVGHSRKAQFLAGVIAGAQTVRQPRFYGSEHFIADAATRVAIQNYIYRAGRRRLPALVAPYQAVLDAAANFPGYAYTILAGGSSSQTGRNAALHSAFTSSVERHNKLFSNHEITLFTRGQFLLGSAHGARQDPAGTSDPTTCELLRRDSWTVCVVRFTVNVPSKPGTIDSSGTIVVPGSESIVVEPLGGGTAIDLLPMLNRIAAGSEFHFNLREAGSPFSRVREEGAADIPYNALYDYLLHLP
jgi:hypothetical protein